MVALWTAMAIGGGTAAGLLFAGWRFLKRLEVPMTRGEAHELKEIAMRSWQRRQEEKSWRT